MWPLSVHYNWWTIDDLIELYVSCHINTFFSLLFWSSVQCSRHFKWVTWLCRAEQLTVLLRAHREVRKRSVPASASLFLSLHAEVGSINGNFSHKNTPAPSFYFVASLINCWNVCCRHWLATSQSFHSYCGCPEATDLFCIFNLSLWRSFVSCFYFCCSRQGDSPLYKICHPEGDVNMIYASCALVPLSWIQVWRV